MFPFSFCCESLAKYFFADVKFSNEEMGKLAEISGAALSFLSNSRKGGITDVLSA
jgi:hypothetical protein